MNRKTEKEIKQIIHQSRLTESNPTDEHKLNNEHIEKIEKKIRRIHLNELRSEYEDVPNLNLIKKGDATTHPKSNFSFEITESRLFNKDIDSQNDDSNNNRSNRKLKNRHER